MPSKSEIKPEIMQEFNYRMCSDCGAKVCDTRIKERGGYVVLATRVGCPRSPRCS